MSAVPQTPPDLNTIRIDVDGEIGVVTLDRPDAFNAMSPDLIGEMMVAFAWLADEAPLRAAILTGAGAAFCAGGDLNWFHDGAADPEVDLPASVRRGADALHASIADLRRVPYPVIGAINGPAAGAGMSLALACDLRIASEKAFLAPAYGRIGASPDGGLTYFLPRIVGAARALELLLDDPDLSAADAEAAGLVSEVVPAESLIERARERATKLAAMAPHYVRMVKSLTNRSFDNSIREHLELERHGIADSMATEDLQTGVAAFFAGEKPRYTGR